MTTIDRREAVRENIASLREKIADAARAAGRDPNDVALHGATKGVPAELIVEACRLGLCEIGENWVQEAGPKIEAVSKALEGTGEAVRWHMIGHLQRNKVREALRLFDSIDTLDSLRLAQEIEKRASTAERVASAFLEIDYTDEPERGGFKLGPQHDQTRLDAFLAEVEQVLAMPHLRIEGLMTVAPMTEDPEGARPAFHRLRDLRDLLRERFPQASLRHLSMGMTHDYPIAIQEGATIVRLGTAIFGARPPGRTY